VLQGDLDVLVNRAKIPLLFLRGLLERNSMLKKSILKKISTIDIPKFLKFHSYVNKMRKLYHARNVIKNAIHR